VKSGLQASARTDDFELRIAQGDDIVRAATSKGHARTASELAAKQDKARAQLAAKRQAIAERIASLTAPRTLISGAEFIEPSPPLFRLLFLQVCHSYLFSFLRSSAIWASSRLSSANC